MSTDPNQNDKPAAKNFSLREDAKTLGSAARRFFKTLRLALTTQQTLDERVVEAAKQMDLAKLEKAVAEGGNINKTSGWRDDTPLLHFINEGNAEAVAKAVALGAKPNLKTGYGEASPMGAAIKKGDPAIVKILLAAGGDPNARTALGHDGFAYAVAMRNDAVADMLLAAGANPDIGTNDSWTALTYAARNNDVKRTAQLLDLGARSYVRDRDGRSVLDIAAAQESFAARDLVQAHIDAQVPAWQKVSDHQSAHVSILRGQGYRLTEIFNFETREATLVTHNFETGRDSTQVRDFADIKNKQRIADAQKMLDPAAAQTPANQDKPQKPAAGTPKAG